MRAARVAETPGAAENAVGAFQIVVTANVAETPGAALIVKEVAKNAVGESQIVRTANLAETPGAVWLEQLGLQ